MAIRPRCDADLGDLVALLRLTQSDHGYPVDPVHATADWLVSGRELGAWVAADNRDGHMVGHVALHEASGVSAPIWRGVTGRTDDELAVVSRLFSRAPGAGTALLNTAVRVSKDAGRTPVLEVDRSSRAYGFYLRRGWAEVGEVRQQWGTVSATVAVMVLAR